MRALGLIGPEAGDAVKTLEVISRDRHSDLQQDATWALKKVSPHAMKDTNVPAE